MKSNKKNGWGFVSLEDIAIHTLGGDWGSEVKSNINPSFIQVKVIRGTDYKFWSRDKAFNAAKRAIKKDSLKKRELLANDIVVEISGGGPDQPVGRVIQIDNETILSEQSPLVCSNFFRQIRLSGAVNPNYIYHFLNFSYLSGHFNNIQTQTTNLRNLNFNEYLKTPIPIPDLSTQSIFADKIGSLKQRIEQIKARIENLSLIGDRLLSYFTEHNINDSNLSLGDYLEQSNDRIGKGFEKLLKVGVDNFKGVIPLRSTRKSNFSTYKVVLPGDFVYNPMRINIGSIGIYNGEKLAITSPDYVVFRIKDTISPLLLLKFLKSDIGLKEINSLTRGSVRSRLYFSSLLQLSFPLNRELQEQANLSLVLFNKLIVKANLISTKLDTFFLDYQEKIFKGEISNKSTEKGIKLLFDEIQEHKALSISIEKMKKSIKKVPTKLPDIEVIKEIIQSNFNKNSFTFQDLEKLVYARIEIDYDDLKDILFNYLREPIGDDSSEVFLEIEDSKKDGLIFKIAK
ncbi:hypothetical protein DHW03_00935 [Pedobacter yonginense]|uniref:Type I restriction modification DNA specificity domain-containing protein n=1 Tax=Pedobacter yonginense TaxID=651869 RepID=A0A317EQ23_9SPHI|nr:restriction endonuclease subunit S [Pedobacter yonginense]PWS28455.1 hypothetical protein DHW03_00935 [Pedobacter yonginense]